MPTADVEHYRGRELQFLGEPEMRVVVRMGERELYSTSAHFSKRAEAIEAARALVDAELDGHRVTPPTNDPAAAPPRSGETMHTPFSEALAGALVEAWPSLPQDMQRHLFEKAAAGRDSRFREDLAVYLHDHHPRTDAPSHHDHKA